MKKTYLVFFEGKEGQKPKKHHETIHSAFVEAARISGMKKAPVLVVEVVGSVQLVDGEQVIETAE